MIPKIIHYCWFGGNPLPKSAEKCIASWKRFFPEYEIKEWNESNYNVRKIPYIAEAYDKKKYAFVSDYARFDIIYHEGGLYFDTDVEVIKPFSDILTEGAFMGCEIDGTLDCAIMVNPGLGMGAPAQLSVFREIMDYYSNEHFLLGNGEWNIETVVSKTTKILQTKGLLDIADKQKIEGIVIYPKRYFNPRSSITGKLHKEQDTHSIHWYSMSWMTPRQKIVNTIARPIRRVLGPKCFHWIRRIEKNENN